MTTKRSTAEPEREGYIPVKRSLQASTATAILCGSVPDGLSELVTWIILYSAFGLAQREIALRCDCSLDHVAHSAAEHRETIAQVALRKNTVMADLADRSSMLTLELIDQAGAKLGETLNDPDAPPPTPLQFHQLVSALAILSGLRRELRDIGPATRENAAIADLQAHAGKAVRALSSLSKRPG